MIAAFTSASCTLSLAVAGWSFVGFWRGLIQAPHNSVKSVQTKTMKEKVTQCMGRECSLVLKGRDLLIILQNHKRIRSRVLSYLLTTAMMESGESGGFIRNPPTRGRSQLLYGVQMCRQSLALNSVSPRLYEFTVLLRLQK